MISDQLRTKQGPLARAWLASHWERKLSKSQFLQTNIEKTIDVIQNSQQEEPIAFRVSGQLLLGVVRIYSRKTKYLLEDCNEALVKIKLAFKKGDVNMPDIHQSIANVHTITLQDKLTEFDILLPDLPFNTLRNVEESDPVMDSFGDLSGSQDFTLSDVQNSFSFGNFETERGVAGGQGVEVGRRDNEAGFADNEFDMDALADPLKDMNLNGNNGLMDDGVDFDFDLNDNIDYGPDYTDDAHEFNLPDANHDTEASLDTLMQVGIVEDSQNMFAMQEVPTETTARRRKRLVVDKVTEIPMEDLHRLVNDTSSLITKDANVSGVTKTKTVIDLTKPSGEALGSELDAMFSRLNRKRRASAAAQLETRRDRPFSVAPPSGGRDTDFQFEDPGFDYTDTGFDDNMGAFDNAARLETTDFNADTAMRQSTQSFNSNTRETLENLEAKFATQNVVKFGELATSSCKKSDAARLFYDVLLLSTKNKIKVKQDRPFGDIQLTAQTTLVQ